MKTKKILMLMAAMLLSCASAFAQSGNNTPAKGDVNEDGTVDVADIVNVIKIMKDGGGAVGEKMCYWYAGTNNGNAVQADNLTDVASRIPESEVPATGSVTANGQYVYFIMPETKHVESLTDGNGSAVEFTCTDVMGYHIYKTNDKISGSINYSVAQTVYYWYVGTTPIDDTNYNDTTIVSQVAIIPAETTITTNNEYLYIVVPKNKVVTVYDENNFEVNMETYNSSTHSFTNAVTYVGDYAIYRSAQKGVGTSRIVVN